MANSEPQIEIVRADDGRRETSWVVGVILVILCCAALMLKYNQQPPETQTQHLELNVTGKAMLTALRNAADEISFLALDSDLPDIASLKASGIPPFDDATGTFDQYRWSQPQANCYLGVSDAVGHPAFVLTVSDHSEVYWTSTSSSIQTSTSVDCSRLDHWQSVSHHD